MEEQLPALVEALLFAYGEALTVERLAKFFGVGEEDIRSSLDALAARYAETCSGTVVIRNGDEVRLGTRPDLGPKITQFFQEEFHQELTPAALETLAIIAYRAPISRPEVEAIRGVNSSFILRSLMMRGLVTREPDPKRQRLWLYRPAIDLLRLLGVNKPEDLPNFETLSKELKDLGVNQPATTET